MQCIRFMLAGLCSIVLVPDLRLATAATVLSVDFDLPPLPSTSPDFTSFPVPFGGVTDASITVDGITVTLNGNWIGRDRGGNNPANDGDFTENLLLRDSAIPNEFGPGPFTVTIAGLQPNTAYDGAVWSYDSPVGTRTFDISVNGVLVRDNFAMTIPPTTNDENRVDFQQIASTGSGELVISFSDINPPVGPTEYAEYRINAIQLTQMVSLVPGDFDGDGDVDGADFVAWQTNFPKASGAILAAGDADGDGDVDGADFVVWQTNFPFTPGPSTLPVPEPKSLFLSSFAGIGLVLGWMHVRRSGGRPA